MMMKRTVQNPPDYGTKSPTKKTRYDAPNVWDWLPSEIIVKIFEQNSYRDDTNVALVCRRWAEIRRQSLLNLSRLPSTTRLVITIFRLGEVAELGLFNLAVQIASALNLIDWRCIPVQDSKYKIHDWKRHVWGYQMYTAIARIAVGLGDKTFLTNVVQRMVRYHQPPPGWETRVLLEIAKYGRRDALKLWVSSRKGIKRRLKNRKHVESIPAGSVEVWDWLENNNIRRFEVDIKGTLDCIFTQYEKHVRFPHGKALLDRMNLDTSDLTLVWHRAIQRGLNELVRILPMPQEPAVFFVCLKNAAKFKSESLFRLCLDKFKNSSMDSTGIDDSDLQDIYISLAGRRYPLANDNSVLQQLWKLTETVFRPLPRPIYYEYCHTKEQVELLFVELKIPLTNWELGKYAEIPYVEEGQLVLTVFQHAYQQNRMHELPEFSVRKMLTMFMSTFGSRAYLHWIYDHTTDIRWKPITASDCSYISYKIGTLICKERENLLYGNWKNLIPGKVKETIVLKEAKLFKKWFASLPHENCNEMCTFFD